MRYALTFRTGESWAEVDTVIVGTALMSDEGVVEIKVAEILTAYGVENADEILENGWWFIRNVDDVDIYLNSEGEVC